MAQQGQAPPSSSARFSVIATSPVTRTGRCTAPPHCVATFDMKRQSVNSNWC
eukprot:CAMPEP_0196740680 /NCGR_PEP_ID=MMETSP1091-20130531/34150_1 /TAXON_ID=302021 /ORGANISM="Rhodomonas sp., Strain CCMP768" /LENGTH=51 /DNA_ID=CAMNT_0042085955 /DNA_START=10 /DNA_END=165 /DNA_ORIENTATION=-